MDQTEASGAAEADLLSALEVIEAQPLHTRAAAYGALHDALARTLDADPTVPRP